MKNRAVLIGIILFIGLFCLTVGFVLGRISNNFTASLFDSPGKEYASEMSVALEHLAEFINGPVASWDVLLATDAGEWTYADYLIFLEVAYEYSSLSDIQASEEYQELNEAADSVIRSGFDVLTELNSITPPNEIQTPHQEIVACVEYELDLMSATKDYLNTGLFKDFDSGCRAFGSAIDKVTQYIQEHGGNVPEIDSDLLFPADE